MGEELILKYFQNFLKSKNLVVKILELSSISSQDLVLEIGPGRGIITEELAKRAREVVAIEKDKGLFLFLREKFKNNLKIKIFNADFLKYQLPKSPYKIFSNIPFFITGEIIKKITFIKPGEKNFLEEAYLIVQKEAAKKFVGQPYAKRNQMTSLFLKPWFELKVIYHFKKTDFYPTPKVNVVLMKIKKRDNPLIEEKQAQIYRDFIVYSFTQFKLKLFLVNKMKKARQFFRTLLYEIRRKDDFVSVIKRVKNSWQSNKILYQKFLNYQKKLKICIVPDIKNLEDYFNQFLKLCDRNLDWFSFYLEKVYHQTNAVEFLLLKNITVDTILKVLFNFNHKVYLKEKNKFKKLENVDLESISIFADLIFGVYLTLGKGKIKRMKSLQEFLNLLSPKDTDFIDQATLNNFRKLGLISLNLNDLHPNKLKKILQNYNNSKISVFEKNRIILKNIK